MSEEYRVIEETPGCKCCNHGKGWIVVDSEDVGGSTVYENIEDAEYEAEVLNAAYEKGRKSMHAVPHSGKGG